MSRDSVEIILMMITEKEGHVLLSILSVVDVKESYLTTLRDVNTNNSSILLKIW